MKLVLDVFSGLTPNGASLGELTKAYSRQVRLEHNGPGAGTFHINRHDDQAAWCVANNYVKVRLADGGPYVTAFWIHEGQDVPVSTDEEGAEDYTRAGRGALAYLERAVIYPPGDADGNRVWTDKSYGYILKALLDEALARSPSPLPDLTYDFTATVDSDGNAWPTIAGDYKLPVGQMNYYEVAQQFQSLDVVLRMDPDLVLHAYTTLGRDLSSTIRFAWAVNIRSAAEREIHATQAKSRLLVQGSLESGAVTFREVSDGAVETVLGRREGYFPYEGTANTAALDVVGAREISRLAKLRDEGTITLGVTIGDGTQSAQGHYVPLTDYTNGDLVTVNVPGEWDELPLSITAITLDETEAGEVDPTLEFNDLPTASLVLPGEGHSTPEVPPPPYVACGPTIDLDGWTRYQGAGSFVGGVLTQIGLDNVGYWTPFPVGATGAIRVHILLDAATTSASLMAFVGTPGSPTDSEWIAVGVNGGQTYFNSTGHSLEYPGWGSVLSMWVEMTTGDGRSVAIWRDTETRDDAYVISYAGSSFTPDGLAVALGLLGGEDATGDALFTLCTSAPPTTGQYVVSVAPVEAADSSRTTFTAPSAYAAHTLMVFVDGIRKAVFETSPAAGTFTLAAAPTTGAEIVLTYTAA